MRLEAKLQHNGGVVLMSLHCMCNGEEMACRMNRVVKVTEAYTAWGGGGGGDFVVAVL